MPKELSDMSLNDDEFGGIEGIERFGSDDGEGEGEDEEFEDCYLGGSRQHVR